MISADQPKTIIGSEEWCAFPDMAIPALKARIDSGAKTSSIHAFNIQPFRRHGRSWVSFEVHPIQNNRRIVIRCEKPVTDRRAVKSSSGLTETRYVVSASMQLGPDSWEIELTLANRDSMGYRMLLGREAMGNRLIIDPSESFCLGKISSNRIRDLYGEKEPKKSGLKIALLASNPDLYSNQRILEAGEERGHEMEFLDIKQCYMKLDARDPEVHYRGGKSLNDLNAVITRIRPSMTFYGCALARQFESMRVYTVNTSDSIAQSRDKLFSLQLMLKSGIDIPTTGFAN
ncbi:MAG: alpha-L-glutamate ligase, partial [Candidatus Electrothrix sp. ATG1]|nr:alpha-L-glutamate ligase [Candidatus Electrothrix sp. ATG1]